jgi:Fic family protein
VLARLHVLAAADVVDADELGRPRLAGQNATDVLKLGPPPAPAEVAARLESLSGLLTAPTKAPALVVAALVHGELLALRPFGWGDGIVARAAQRLTLVERGLDPKSLTAPEVGHAELADEYVLALRGYLAGSSEGVAAWVCHCADAVTVAARDSLAICEAFMRG